MNKKKLIIFLIIGCIGAGTIYGIVKKSNSEGSNDKSNTTILSENLNKTEEVKDKQEIIDIKLNPDKVKTYNNVESLANDAEIIVKGTVLEATSYMLGPCAITEYKLKVNTAYKNANEGDVITLAVAGGTVPYEEYLNSSADKSKDIKSFEKNTSEEKIKNAKIKMTMGENDLIQIGKEYAIFAKMDKISEDKSMYCTLNVDEGTI